MQGTISRSSISCVHYVADFGVNLLGGASIFSLVFAINIFFAHRIGTIQIEGEGAEKSGFLFLGMGLFALVYFIHLKIDFLLDADGIHFSRGIGFLKTKKYIPYSEIDFVRIVGLMFYKLKIKPKSGRTFRIPNSIRCIEGSVPDRKDDSEMPVPKPSQLIYNLCHEINRRVALVKGSCSEGKGDREF